MRLACCRPMRARTPSLPSNPWNTRNIQGGRAFAKKYGHIRKLNRLKSTTACLSVKIIFLAIQIRWAGEAWTS